MESTSLCSGSTAPTFLANKSLSLGMANPDEENTLGHKSPTSSASKKTAQVLDVEGAFKCKLCPCAFKTARARGGHQKAHRQLWAPVKKQKTHKGGPTTWSPASILPTSSYATALCSACLHAQPFADWSSHYDPSVRPVPPSFPWKTVTGGATPAQLLAPAAGYRGTQDGGNLGSQHGVRDENQKDTANGIDLTLKL